MLTIGKADLSGDDIERQAALLQHQPGGLHAQSFHRLGGDWTVSALNALLNWRGRILAGLLLLWGVSATLGNVWSGRLVDRFGSRPVVNGLLGAGALGFRVLPWASAHAGTAAIALVVGASADGAPWAASSPCSWTRIT